MKRALLLTALCCLAAASAARAHELIQTVTRASAVVIELKYGDNSPFSYEQFEIYRKGEDTPFQTGRTDVLGRIVFLPDRAASWRVRAFSEDGHGTDFTIDAGPAEAGESRAGSPGASEASVRSMKIFIGVFVILLIFVIALRVIRRRAS
jgi:nickel transport protein